MFNFQMNVTHCYFNLKENQFLLFKYFPIFFDVYFSLLIKQNLNSV